MFDNIDDYLGYEIQIFFRFFQAIKILIKKNVKDKRNFFFFQYWLYEYNIFLSKSGYLLNVLLLLVDWIVKVTKNSILPEFWFGNYISSSNLDQTFEKFLKT